MEGPPLVIAGEFEDRPERWAPYAGGTVFSIALVAVAAILLIGGAQGPPNDQSADPPGDAQQSVVVPSPSRAPEDDRRESVSVVLGALNESDGLNHISQGDGLTGPSERAGRSCRELLATGDPVHYAYFQVDDGFIYATKTPVEITVEYFDEGASEWSVAYDGVSDPFTQEEPVVNTEGSESWRTHTFLLADATFGNRQQGEHDFRIIADAELALCISQVTVRRQAPTVRVRLSTTSDWASLELPAAVVREVRLVAPTTLPEGWSANIESLRLAQTIAEAERGGEIELIVDVRIDVRALEDGLSLPAQKGGIGSSRVRLFAIDGETAQLVFEATLEPGSAERFR